MKSNAKQPEISNNPGKKRAENKDNLDHRKNEEQDSKGDDQTHNSKHTKAQHLKKKD